MRKYKDERERDEQGKIATGKREKFVFSIPVQNAEKIFFQESKETPSGFVELW